MRVKRALRVAACAITGIIAIGAAVYYTIVTKDWDQRFYILLLINVVCDICFTISDFLWVTGYQKVEPTAVKAYLRLLAVD